MKKIILSLIVFFYSQLILAQISFNNLEYDFGYVVTITGDTIKGEVMAPDHAGSDMRIKFKDNSGKESVIRTGTYSAYSVRGIDFRSIPVSMLGGNEYAEVLADGELILLTYTSHTYNSNSKSYDAKIKYFVQRQKDPKSLDQIKPLGFKKTMLAFVGNYPELATKVNNKDLGFDNLKEIIEDYNRRDNK